MVYRTPGSYVRFIKNVKPKDTTETTRIMGLVGTGSDYYEVYNEVVTKGANIGDQLAHGNIDQIYSVSLKPMLTAKSSAGNTIYEQGTHFNYVNSDGRGYLVWNALPDAPASIVIKNETMSAAAYAAFTTTTNPIINYSIDDANRFLVKNGTFRLTVDVVDTVNGVLSFKDINSSEPSTMVYANGENIAEFTAMGINFSVDTTSIMDVDGTTPLIKIGDSILVTTKAASTQIPATAVVVVDAENSTPAFVNVIDPIVVDQSAVQTAIYELIIKDIAVGTFDIKIQGASTVLFNGTIGLEKDYIGVIPGVSFNFEELYLGAQVGDKVVIQTTAAQQGTAPVNGASYYVSYKYSKALEDYTSKIFYEYEDVIKEYGQYEVSPSSGVVKNSLSLAAEIAFQAGISPIVCTQVTSDSDAAYKEAIDLLEHPIPGLRNVNVIIPLTSSYIVGQYLRDHILLMSNPENGKERMAYLSASIRQPISQQRTTQNPLMGMVETAKSYNEERIVYVAPGEIIREITDLNTGKIYDALLPACYAAVAVASIALSNDPAEPLTNKVLIGFKSLAQSLLESEKKQLSAAGCLVLEQDSYVIKIRHGVTTATFDPTIVPGVGVDNSAAVEQMEITLVQIKDYVSDLARVSTAKYIGTKNKATSVAEVKQTITTLLNQLIAREIIIGVQGLIVRRSKDDPREIEVMFDIEAVYPLNYITISFGFAL